MGEETAGIRWMKVEKRGAVCERCESAAGAAVHHSSRDRFWYVTDELGEYLGYYRTLEEAADALRETHDALLRCEVGT